MYILVYIFKHRYDFLKPSINIKLYYSYFNFFLLLYIKIKYNTKLINI